jgi:hypothetical protein
LTRLKSNQMCVCVNIHFGRQLKVLTERVISLSDAILVVVSTKSIVFILFKIDCYLNLIKQKINAEFYVYRS